MDLLDSKGVKTSKNIIDKKIYNFYIKKSEFIDNPVFYEDKELLNILKLNYLNDGIVCKTLIKNEVKDSLYFTNSKYLDNSLKFNIKIIPPSIFLTEINKNIDKLKNILDVIEKNDKEIKEKDSNIIEILKFLRNSNYMKYLDNLLNFNNLRLLINRIFFEYYQDLNFYLNRLNQVKYDFFVTENNIILLLENYYKINHELENIISEKIYLLTNNNNKCIIKESNGNINYDKFINIIQSSIENI